MAATTAVQASGRVEGSGSGFPRFSPDGKLSTRLLWDPMRPWASRRLPATARVDSGAYGLQRSP